MLVDPIGSCHDDVIHIILLFKDIVAEIDEDEKATMPDPAEKFEELLMRFMS